MLTNNIIEYIYIYVCMYVCVCVSLSLSLSVYLSLSLSVISGYVPQTMYVDKAVVLVLYWKIMVV